MNELRKPLSRIIASVVFVFVLAAALSMLFACGSVVLKSIEIECVKTQYTEGDSFDESDLIVTAVYSDGSKRTVTGFTTDAPEKLTAGETTLTVTYVEDDVTATGQIKITVAAAEHTHSYGEEWQKDANGHWRECECGEKSDEAAHTWKAKTEIITEATCETEGKKIVTCSVCGYSEEQAIPALGHDFSVAHYDETQHWYSCSRCDASDLKADHIYALVLENVRTEWYEGDTFSLDGASAELVCDCGKTNTVEIGEITLSKTELTIDDNGTAITCTYGDAKCDVTVNVSTKSITGIEISDGYRYDYDYSEQFADSKLTVSYNNGSTEEIALTADMISGFDTSSAGIKSITATYEGKTCQFDIRVGYDAEAGAYKFPESMGQHKVQVEDDVFVDMSGAQLQEGTATNKFENTTNLTDGSVVPNGAEGYSTSNISVNGNKIVIRFSSPAAGLFKLGIRAQSGTNKGLSDQNIAEAFTVTVNGMAVTINGTIGKACTGTTGWKDMLNWTILEDIAGGVYMSEGLNEIVFTYLGEAGTLRLPNIDYFTIDVVEEYQELSIKVDGDVSIPMGGEYKDGITLSVYNGEKLLTTLPVTADMISGLDTSSEGTCEITVTYLGLSVKHTVTISAPHEHAYGDEWVTDETSHWHECECGERSEEAAHIWVEDVEAREEATCDKTGKKVFNCSVCGYSKEETIPALGHDFSVVQSDETQHWHKCSRCDAIDEKKDHTFSFVIDGYRADWMEGETFSLEGATAELVCECGKSNAVETGEITLSKTELTVEDNDTTITCTYGEYTFEITVYVTVKGITDIEVEGGYHYDYDFGEQFKGATLNVYKYDGGTEQVVITEDMITDFDTTSAGVKKITVTYEGETCQFEIRVGYDKDVNAYKLPGEVGKYKIQVEDDAYVDMSKAQLQEYAVSKFEQNTTLTDGSVVPNGAEGYSTSNISVNGNKIIIRLSSPIAGMFKLGMRAQSGSNKGLSDQNLAEAFTVTVNGVPAKISGILEKACTGSTGWKDMLNWTVLDSVVSGVYMGEGLNEIVFTYLGEADVMRLPNIDYFTIEVVEVYEELSLKVEGEVSLNAGEEYTEGLTLSVYNGETLLTTLPVSAGMISGLDTSQAGTCEITVTYLGVSVKHSIEVISNEHILTIEGGTFADGKNTVSIKYGEAIPEITWASENIVGWLFDGKAYGDITGLTMCATDATLKAITADEANNIKLGSRVRYNVGATDGNGKTSALGGELTTDNVKFENTTEYKDSDAAHYIFSDVNSAAKGFTDMHDVNFGSGNMVVFVKIINNGDTDISGMSYGTELGIVNVGNVGAGQSAVGAATIQADGNNHWTHVFWDGELSALDVTIAIYTYAIS